MSVPPIARRFRNVPWEFGKWRCLFWDTACHWVTSPEDAHSKRALNVRHLFQEAAPRCQQGTMFSNCSLDAFNQLTTVRSTWSPRRLSATGFWWLVGLVAWFVLCQVGQPNQAPCSLSHHHLLPDPEMRQRRGRVAFHVVEEHRLTWNADCT